MPTAALWLLLTVLVGATVFFDHMEHSEVYDVDFSARRIYDGLFIFYMGPLLMLAINSGVALSFALLASLVGALALLFGSFILAALFDEVAARLRLQT